MKVEICKVKYTSAKDSKALMLLRVDRLRAIHCQYENTPNAKKELFKTYDTTIGIGDLVVVPTEYENRHGATVARVCDVDVDFDPDAIDEFSQFIVQRIDPAPFIRDVEEEKRVLAMVRQGRRKAHLEKVLRETYAGQEELLQAVNASPQMIEAARITPAPTPPAPGE